MKIRSSLVNERLSPSSVDFVSRTSIQEYFHKMIFYTIKIDDLIISLSKRVRLEDVTKSRDHREVYQINQEDDHRDRLSRSRFRLLENRVY